jgi:hypothetical protein
MTTLYFVHAFNTLDGRPDLQHMQRCVSLEAAWKAGQDFTTLYHGVLVYSREAFAGNEQPGAPGPRTIHFRDGSVPADQPDDVLSVLELPVGLRN